MDMGCVAFQAHLATRFAIARVGRLPVERRHKKLNECPVMADPCLSAIGGT